MNPPAIPPSDANDRGYLERLGGRLEPAWGDFSFEPGSRAAAVVAILLRRGGHWIIPFVVRRPDLRSHPGQVGLPGGSIETGETPWEAAARESEEELGVPAAELIPLGSGGRTHLSVHNYCVLPFVAYLGDPDATFIANPQELTGVLEVRLDHLLDPERWRIDRSSRLGRHFPTQPTPIWGLTVRLLDDLLPRLEAAL
ncbi:MAG TPA: NUDIX domain-containing protein [Candidatus Nitrosotalea sp.]|nr:NUDIX domain-containing protein [Candidatus Nitrosotalea sp.]